jgi:hypothetical protein
MFWRMLRHICLLIYGRGLFVVTDIVWRRLRRVVHLFFWRDPFAVLEVVRGLLYIKG